MKEVTIEAVKGNACCYCVFFEPDETHCTTDGEKLGLPPCDEGYIYKIKEKLMNIEKARRIIKSQITTDKSMGRLCCAKDFEELLCFIDLQNKEVMKLKETYLKS